MLCKLGCPQKALGSRVAWAVYQVGSKKKELSAVDKQLLSAVNRETATGKGGRKLVIRMIK